MRWAWVRSTLQPDSKLAYVLEEAAVGGALQAVVCVYLNMRGGVWVPSVIIQGKLFIGMGPLHPNDGTPSVYSQLYVLDPDQEQSEIDLRFQK